MSIFKIVSGVPLSSEKIDLRFSYYLLHILKTPAQRQPNSREKLHDFAPHTEWQETVLRNLAYHWVTWQWEPSLPHSSASLQSWRKFSTFPGLERTPAVFQQTKEKSAESKHIFKEGMIFSTQATLLFLTEPRTKVNFKSW